MGRGSRLGEREGIMSVFIVYTASGDVIYLIRLCET